MRLRQGVTAAQAVTTLRDLAGKAGNIQGQHAGEDIARARDAYLQWADNAEDHLRRLFPYRSMVGPLQTDRYWRIHELDGHSARPWPIIRQEIDLQRGLLDASAMTLESYADLRERAGEPMVLDTNVFLHCKLFTEIDWSAEFAVDIARLVVPAVVLDELDEKTFSRNAQLAKRADKVLRALARFTDTIVSDGSADIRAGVTLELLLDDDDHRRRTSNDVELLDRAVFLHQVIEQPVAVVTADLKMAASGKLRGLRMLPVPDRLRLPISEEPRPHGSAAHARS